MVEAEPQTVIRLDTPAGLIATVETEGTRARAVTIENVEFRNRTRCGVRCRTGHPTHDMAFGEISREPLISTTNSAPNFGPQSGDALLDIGMRIMDAINATPLPSTQNPAIDHVHHVQLLHPAAPHSHFARMVIHPGVRPLAVRHGNALASRN